MANNNNSQVTTQQQLISIGKSKASNNSLKNHDYYSSNSQHSNASETSEIVQLAPAGTTSLTSPSKIMLTAVIKPQLDKTNTTTNTLEQSQFAEISQFFNSNDQSTNISNGFEHLLGSTDKTSTANLNISNYKNKNYFKYVMNQQKKRQQLSSSNNNSNINSISNEALNNIDLMSGNVKRQVQLVNHEVPMHSNLNNISSNALLIRRLKF